MGKNSSCIGERRRGIRDGVALRIGNKGKEKEPISVFPPVIRALFSEPQRRAVLESREGRVRLDHVEQQRITRDWVSANRYRLTGAPHLDCVQRTSNGHGNTHGWRIGRVFDQHAARWATAGSTGWHQRQSSDERMRRRTYCPAISL